MPGLLRQTGGNEHREEAGVVRGAAHVDHPGGEDPQLRARQDVLQAPVVDVRIARLAAGTRVGMPRLRSAPMIVGRDSAEVRTAGMAVPTRYSH